MRKGFTIVEIAIVLVMVGILIAGLIAGASILSTSKAQGLTKELQSYRQAAFLFREKFQAWPGDIADATDRWNSTVNGGGNNLIANTDDTDTSAAEKSDFYYHLMKSGFIPDVTTTVGGSLNGVNTFPGSRIFTNSEFRVGNNNTDRNYIYVYSLQQDSGGKFLTAKDMLYIDNKTDDSRASSGDLTEGDGAQGCVSGGTYLVNNNSVLCYPRYYFNAN